MEEKKPHYKRILVKLSGEALSNGDKGILNYDFLEEIGHVIKTCIDMGTQVSIVVGAGNIWRGRQGTGMDRCRADHMGMLATMMNAIDANMISGDWPYVARTYVEENSDSLCAVFEAAAGDQIPNSNMKRAIAQILLDEGYIKGFEVDILGKDECLEKIIDGFDIVVDCLVDFEQKFFLNDFIYFICAIKCTFVYTFLHLIITQIFTFVTHKLCILKHFFN